MAEEYTNTKKRNIIEIGENVFLPNQAKISVPLFSILSNSRINGPITIRGRQECHIGKYCALGYNITIITTNHDITKPNLQLNMQRSYGFADLEISDGPVLIGNNVWLGDNVTVLSGVTIGDGSVVGAGAVVTRNVEPCSVVGGVPSKLIKYRFQKDIIELFLSLQWWNWSENKINRNKSFFETDLTKVTRLTLEKIIIS